MLPSLVFVGISVLTSLTTARIIPSQESIPSLFARCVVCPDDLPSCPDCPNDQVCSYTSATCNQCAYTVCIGEAGVQNTHNGDDNEENNEPNAISPPVTIPPVDPSPSSTSSSPRSSSASSSTSLTSSAPSSSTTSWTLSSAPKNLVANGTTPDGCAICPDEVPPSCPQCAEDEACTMMTATCQSCARVVCVKKSMGSGSSSSVSAPSSVSSSDSPPLRSGQPSSTDSGDGEGDGDGGSAGTTGTATAAAGAAASETVQTAGASKESVGWALTLGVAGLVGYVLVTGI